MYPQRLQAIGSADTPLGVKINLACPREGCLWIAASRRKLQWSFEQLAVSSKIAAANAEEIIKQQHNDLQEARLQLNRLEGTLLSHIGFLRTKLNARFFRAFKPKYFPGRPNVIVTGWSLPILPYLGLTTQSMIHESPTSDSCVFVFTTQESFARVISPEMWFRTVSGANGQQHELGVLITRKSPVWVMFDSKQGKLKFWFHLGSATLDVTPHVNQRNVRGKPRGHLPRVPKKKRQAWGLL